MDEMNAQARMPLIGDHAPEFRAMTTMGKVNFPQDYKGSWVILFSHPGDFTPVCTTEFIAFARMAPEFEAMNTRLIGLSIDSLSSHLAWVKDIEGIDPDGKGAVKVPFPIIVDLSMNVARKYGMLQTVARTATIRAVYIIDPEGVIRTILYYPMSTGRNMDEIKRIVQALQYTDEHGVSTPADWRPGTSAVYGSPKTLEEARERMEHPAEDMVPLTWYLTMKKPD